MKSSELRIGNIVRLQKDGAIFIIDSVSEIGLDVHDNIENTWIELDQFESLPLTEEWFDRFGFTKIGSMFYKSNGSVDVYFNVGIVGIDIEGQCIGLPHITSVHQLQNLYYALNNEELTLITKT